MKVGMDQTAAWILAVLGGLGLYAGFYAWTKIVADNQRHQQELELQQVDDDDQDLMQNEHDIPSSNRDASNPNDDMDTPEDSDDMHAPEEKSEHSHLILKQEQEVASWNYQGQTGPAKWADLHPDYTLCRDGHAQSPLNLTNSTLREDLGPLIFRYNRARLHMIHNAKQLIGEVSRGQYLEEGETRYELRQLSFHTPSAHQIEGVPYDVEIQLFHESRRKELLIVSILMEEGREQNSSLVNIFSKIIKEEGVKGPLVRWNPSEVLPEISERSYYAYKGSLIEPPCKENIQWRVLKKVQKISKFQVDKLISLVHHNARPLQDIGERELSMSI
ncbi:MAG: carbonic anhydrase family protein [Oligoflexales bacterium]